MVPDAALLLVSVLAIVGGFGVTLQASRRAVMHARALADATAVPPFILGVTLFAVGTDLPEIANSIVASVSGHGDINVGDSVGSAATQATLVLGLLPLIVGAFAVGRAEVGRISTAIVVALTVAVALFADGFIGRPDALVLIALWLIGSVFVWRGVPPDHEPVEQVDGRTIAGHATITLGMLAGVGAGAAAAMWGLIQIAALVGAAEYTVAFVVGSIGTSLPELVVDVTALRAGSRSLAIGDVFGSSFVDSTLSIGAGPLIAPTAITAALAQEGAVATAAVVAAVAVMLILAGRHTRWTGIACLVLWGLVYAAIIA